MRHMLMGSALRAYAPENDEGFEDDADTGDDLGELDEDAEDDLDPDVNDELDEPGDEDEPEPERRPTRGENRVAAATRTAAEARTRAEAAERRIAELEARVAQPQVSPEEHQRRRSEHLATLTESQRTEFLLNEMRQENQRTQAQVRFESYDASDKAAFAALAAKTPAIRALEVEVEERLALLRKDGGNIAREAVAKFLLGEKAMAKATRANNAGAKRSQAGRERQVVRPSNGRGDVAAERSRKGSSVEDRLRDVKL